MLIPSKKVGLTTLHCELKSVVTTVGFWANLELQLIAYSRWLSCKRYAD